jgi:alpha-1,2-mannosyltransferase
MSDEKTWEKVTCQSFLDAGSTSTIGRLIWVPDWPSIPARFRRTWGEHCLLRRND